MHWFMSIHLALAFLALLSFISGFNFTPIFDFWDQAPPLVQAAFGLRSKRQNTSILSPTIVTTPQPAPSTLATVIGGGSVTSINIVTTAVIETLSALTSLSSNTWQNPSITAISTPGCAVGSISFNGGCCPSDSLLNCNGVTVCTSACITSANPFSNMAAAPSKPSNPILPSSILTSSSPIDTPSPSPTQSLSTSPINNEVQSASNPPNQAASPNLTVTVTGAQAPGSSPSNPSNPSNPSPNPNSANLNNDGNKILPTTSYQPFTITISGSPIVTSTPLPLSTDSSSNTSLGGLPTAAKAGIGAGIGLTFFLLLALFLWLIFSRRRNPSREGGVGVDEVAVVGGEETARLPMRGDRESCPPAYTPGPGPSVSGELDGQGVMMGGRRAIGGRAAMGGGGGMGRRGRYAEAEGNWKVRYELSPTVQRYNEMPAVEVFRVHEMDAKGVM